MNTIQLLHVLPPLDHCSFLLTSAQAVVENPALEALELLEAAEQILEPGVEELWEAIVPEDFSDAVAVSLSEGIAGIASGLVTKIVTQYDGNLQTEGKDSFSTNAGSQASFFATRAGLRAVIQVLGSSSVLFNILALFLATIVSEVIKAYSRELTVREARAVMRKGPTTYALMKKLRKEEKEEERKKMMGMDMPDMEMPLFENKISKTEIASDVCKWVTYDLLIPRNFAEMVPLNVAAVCGACAGVSGQLIKESKKKREEAGFENGEGQRLARSAFESALQFSVYEGTRMVLMLAPIASVMSRLSGS